VKVVVVGAGIFGITASLELARRGHDVTVIDAGTIPHEDASSTDLSKAVRLDYGTEVFWTEMAEASFPGWREWHDRWRAKTGDAILHDDGFLFLTREKIAAGSFEYDSMELLTRRGRDFERLDEATIRRRYPMFDEQYVDGYLNPHDGWVESARVVELLTAELREARVRVVENLGFGSLLESDGVVAGVETADGAAHHADVVIVAAGAWTPFLLPWLENGPHGALVRCVAQSVFYLQVDDPDAWRAPRLPTWSADISRTGWYGFPAVGDIVKVANHGPGRVLQASDSRTVLPEEEARCRAFLADSVPALSSAPIVRRRICPYSDSWDGAFLIDHDPDHRGLVVATGGSGHAFKFAPLLGDLVSDVVERRENRWAARFRWRRPGMSAVEGARNR
jgi:glycine/D-amino acid oxidase-like deaminating enzyme